MASLVRCPACGIHVHADAAACPFCGSSRGLPVKRLVAAAAGVVAFVSGIGCAYGCPADTCGSAYDASTDVLNRPDVTVNDGGPDVGAQDAAKDAPLDAPSDGPVDAPGDAIGDAASDG